MGLISIVCSDPRQSFGIISLLFSGYTLFLAEHVFGEQRGGAAEILSRIGDEVVRQRIEDYDGEFFQEDGVKGSFEIDLIEAQGMEVDNESGADEDAGDEVQNVKDLELLQRLHLGNDSDDDIPDHDDYF